MIRNKRTIMAFAACQVLFFHLWIALFPANTFAHFLKRVAFTGVDLFFLVSGWSLGANKINDAKAFLRSRVESVYVKFALFAIIAGLLGSWSFSRTLSVLTTLELWQKGGGAFLWFAPAILLFYLLALVCQKAMEHHGLKSIALGLLLWFGIGLIVNRFSSYTAMFIFFNRIPIFLLGYACAQSKWLRDNVQQTQFCLTLGLPLLLVGLFAAYFGITPVYVHVPFRDFFYVFMIPLSLGLALVLSCITETKRIKKIGSSTLEMYGVQMVFGYGFASKCLAYTNSALLTNIGTFVFVCLFSVLLSSLYRSGKQLVSKRAHLNDL